MLLPLLRTGTWSLAAPHARSIGASIFVLRRWPLVEKTKDDVRGYESYRKMFFRSYIYEHNKTAPSGALLVRRIKATYKGQSSPTEVAGGRSCLEGEAFPHSFASLRVPGEMTLASRFRQCQQWRRGSLLTGKAGSCWTAPLCTSSSRVRLSRKIWRRKSPYPGTKKSMYEGKDHKFPNKVAFRAVQYTHRCCSSKGSSVSFTSRSIFKLGLHRRIKKMIQNCI